MKEKGGKNFLVINSEKPLPKRRLKKKLVPNKNKKRSRKLRGSKKQKKRDRKLDFMETVNSGLKSATLGGLVGAVPGFMKNEALKDLVRDLEKETLMLRLESKQLKVNTNDLFKLKIDLGRALGAVESSRESLTSKFREAESQVIQNVSK